MSVTLWLDTAKEETIELGGTSPFYEAWEELARVAGKEWGTVYAALAGVATQCELQTDAPAGWLADARVQATKFLASHGKGLSAHARWLLKQLED